MLKSASLLAALVLAGCSNPEAEFDGDIIVNGMEPAFWSATYTATAKSTVISSVGARDVTGEALVKSKGAKEGELVLTSKTPEGDFVVMARKEECMDGMSERKYQWSASVAWQGETLKGCAGSVPVKAKPPAG